MRTVAVMGSPVETLLDVVRKEDADLLVVGNRGLAGIKGRLLGSVPADATRRSVRRARRPHHRLRLPAHMDDPGAGPAPDAQETLERLLLGGPRRYTRLQVAELAGMPPTRTQRLWRALGFPDAADDDPAFTDADVEALHVLSTMIDSGFVGPDTEASIARAMGQALSRRPTGRPTCSPTP